MRRSGNGFTLIELLIVISIIVLLMALLVPQMGAVAMSIKIRDTEHRIALLHQTVLDYKAVYNACPPSTSPDRNMLSGQEGSYPDYYLPDGSKATYLFNHNQWLRTPYGGKLLAYFLMGPSGRGWHRPKNPRSKADPDYYNRSITGEWDPPPALSEFFDSSPVAQGGGGEFPFPAFLDAFGLQDKNGGVIGYSCANPRGSSYRTRWYNDTNGSINYAFYSAIYGDCCSHPYYPGDDRFKEHMERMLTQCPHDFALISAGPNHRFGYQVYGKMFHGKYMKGWWSDFDNGLIDDMANYPLN